MSRMPRSQDFYSLVHFASESPSLLRQEANTASFKPNEKSWMMWKGVGEFSLGQIIHVEGEPTIKGYFLPLSYFHLSLPSLVPEKWLQIFWSPAPAPPHSILRSCCCGPRWCRLKPENTFAIPPDSLDLSMAICRSWRGARDRRRSDNPRDHHATGLAGL